MKERLEIVTHVMKNQFSSFYTNYYRDRISLESIQTSADWLKIPILDRPTIANAPIEDRIFIPRENVRLLFFTSGTSGRGVIGVPRARTRSGPILFPNATAILGFRAGLEIDSHEKIPLVYGDAMALQESAQMAASFPVPIDSIDASPPVLIQLAPHIDTEMGIDRIRTIAVHNERCTLLQHAALARLYPFARIENWLGMVEYSGYIAFSPQFIDAQHPLALQTSSYAFIEILDPVGIPVAAGESGALVVTTLDTGAAFPLVRYRTGDEARVLNVEPFIFELLGRAGDGRIRIPGGELISEEIEQVLRAMLGMRVIDFEGTVRESLIDTKILTNLTLTLELTEPLDDTFRISAAEEIASHLKVNQTRTFADGIREGLYAPLTCEIRQPTTVGKKRQRLQDLRA